MTQTNIAVILAGGKGNRMNSPTPKQFMTINGQTILAKSIMAFATHPQITHIQLVSHPDWVNTT